MLHNYTMQTVELIHKKIVPSRYMGHICNSTCGLILAFSGPDFSHQYCIIATCDPHLNTRSPQPQLLEAGKVRDWPWVKAWGFSFSVQYLSVCLVTLFNFLRLLTSSSSPVTPVTPVPPHYTAMGLKVSHPVWQCSATSHWFDSKTDLQTTWGFPGLTGVTWG